MGDTTTGPPSVPPEGTPASGSEPITGDAGKQKPVEGAPGSPGPKQATDVTDKQQRELDKLELEIESLNYKHSIKGRLIDVALAVGPLAALFTLIWTILWTVHVNQKQQDQQRLDAASARVERAYAKLGSQLPSERASGVAQLSALLHTDGGSRDQEMLTALVNQLGLDDNPAVGSAIVNIFEHLDQQTAKTALDAALQNVVQLQNVLVQSSGMTPFELSTAWRDERRQFLITQAYSRSGNRDPQPINDAAQLYLDNLFALKSGLLSLLKAGGSTKDMNGIFCPGCDFGQLGLDLSGVSFRNAILSETKWDGLRMERADFRDAILDRSKFWASNLQGANFSQEQGNRNRQLDVESRYYRNAVPTHRAFNSVGPTEGTPDFTCADLRNARFDNYPLLVRSNDPKLPDYTGKPVRPIDWSFLYRGANIAGADFTTIREIVLEPIKPGRRLAPYAAVNLVAGPEGARYHYYASDESLRYLQFQVFNKKFIESVSGRRNLEAVAVALSETRNYEQAKLPEGVLPLIQANPASHRSMGEFCKRWSDGIKRMHQEHPASR
jgi:hypothetical protein